MKKNLEIDRPFKCPLCSYAAKTISLLNSHTSQVHSTVRPFKCPTCPYACKTKSALKIHQRTHTGEKPFQCLHTGCQYSCSTSSSLQAHQVVHDEGEKKFGCSVCHQKFRSKIHLNKHHLSVHADKKKFSCQNCSYKCTQPGALKTHIARLHSEERPFKCPHQVELGCVYAAKTRHQLNIHLKSKFHLTQSSNGGGGGPPNLKMYDCTLCDYQTTLLSSLNIHTRTHTGERPYKCQFENCHHTAATSSSLGMYQLTHKKDKTFSCPQCPYKAVTMERVERHKKIHEAPKKLYACAHCDYKARQRVNVRLHEMRIHSLEQKFKCSLCNYKATNKYEVTRHMKGFHHGVDDQTKKYECALCPFKSRYSGNLKIHQRAVHEKKRQWQCPHCEYKTDQKGHLTGHVKTLHGEPDVVKRFVCPWCPYNSYWAQSLATHIRTHTQEKPFKCPHASCQFSAKSSSAVASHRKCVHFDEKNFSCQLCPYKTKTQRNLERHQITHDDRKPFQCDQSGCQFRTKQPIGLQRHFLAVHSNLKQWKCDQCDYASHRRERMKDHFQRIHVQGKKRKRWVEKRFQKL